MYLMAVGRPGASLRLQCSALRVTTNTPPSSAPSTPAAPPRGRPWALRLTDLFLQASLVGVAASVLLHVAAGLLAAGIVVVAVGGGSGPGRGSTLAVDVPLALLSESELQEIEAASLASAATPVPDLPGFEAPKVDLSTAGASSGAAKPGEVSLSGGSGGAGLGGAGSDGFGEGLGGAGGGGARFFGVEARGSRIAYIVDVSGSMAGPKLETLKRELDKSIDSLLEHASFAVMLFSSEARPLDTAGNKWSDASTKGKRNAAQRISAIIASGGTNPERAFELVFSLRPKPDAIYFMTDGLFAAEIAPQIESMNRDAGPVTPIHCIAFVSQEAESLLRGIALASDGTYTYVAGP